MTQARTSLSATLGRFILGLLIVSAGLLAWSYRVHEAIGASFLLGGSLLCAASASLLLSFRFYLRGVVAPVEHAEVASRAVLAGWLSKVARAPSAELRLRRHSGHRLDGELLVRAAAADSETLIRVAVDRPPGSRIAIGAADGGAVPTSVSGAQSEQRIERTIPPGSAECIDVHLLLDDHGVRAPRVALTLEFAPSGARAARRRCTVQAAIPT